MAKTFYGYAEREADSFVDWSQIGKDITTMLQTEVQLRENKKQALEDATRAYEEQLANAPQGEYTDANEYMSNFSNDATQAMLMQERLLKSGQLKVKDYVLARDNLVSGTDQMFKIAEEYQTAYSEGLKRWKNEESSYREFWQLSQAEGLANFQNTRAMINPTNFKVSIAKMMKNKDGVYEMSKDPNDFMTVNELRNRLQGKFDKFDLKGETQAAVSTLGDMEEVIVSAAKYEGGINTIIKNSDAKKGNYYLPGDEQMVNGYKKWETNTIKSFMSNPNNTMSLLTDFNIKSKDGQQIEPTYNYEQFKNDKTGRYVYLDTSKGSKEGVPVFKPEQEKQVEEALRTNIRAQIDVKATASTSNRAFTPTATKEFKEEMKQKRNKIDTYMRHWVNMSKFGSNASASQAANDALIGNNPIVDDQGNAVINIDKKPGGLTVYYRNDKGGKIFKEDINFSKPSDYVTAINFILPKGLKDVLSNDELEALGKKHWGEGYGKTNGFNPEINQAGRTIDFSVPNMKIYSLDDDGNVVMTELDAAYGEVNKSALAGMTNDTQRAESISTVTSRVYGQYNNNLVGDDRLSLTVGTAPSGGVTNMYVADQRGNRVDYVFYDGTGMANAKKQFDLIPLEINKGTYGEDVVNRDEVAGKIISAASDYSKVLNSADKDANSTVLVINGKNYTVDDIMNDKSQNADGKTKLDLVVDMMIKLGNKDAVQAGATTTGGSMTNF